MNWDIATFQWLNSFAGISPYLNWWIVFSAEYLFYVMFASFFVFPVLPLFLAFRETLKKNIRLFVFGMASSLIARYAVTELIRFLYDRPRPFLALPHAIPLISHPSSASFPSGHAVFAFALATAVFFSYRRIGILFFVAALLVGVARIAAGVHWPSDILGGAVVGIAVTYALWLLFARFIYIKEDPGIA